MSAPKDPIMMAAAYIEVFERLNDDEPNDLTLMIKGLLTTISEQAATIEAVKALAGEHWDWKAGVVLAGKLRELVSTPTTEAVKLDPEPWMIAHNGVVDGRTSIFKTRFENGFGEIVTRLFRPRPGYSQVKSDYVAKLPVKGENDHA